MTFSVIRDPKPEELCELGLRDAGKYSYMIYTVFCSVYCLYAIQQISLVENAPTR